MTSTSVARRAEERHPTHRRWVFVTLIAVMLAVALVASAAYPTPAEAYESQPSSYAALSGADRYQTAILVSQRGYPDGAPVVVLVKGDDFPDALAAAPVAAAYGGPVLLTPSSGLTAPVIDELSRLAPQKVFFVGLPEALRPSLRAALPGAEIATVRGPDRYVTAALLADEIRSKKGSVPKIALAPGDSFADALSVAPLAASKGWAILLTPQSGPLPRATSDKIEGLGATSAFVVGTMVEPPACVKQVIRRVGTDRYHTSALVAEYGKAAGLSYAHLGLVKGDNYPDGLVAGSYLGLDDGLLLLVGPTGLRPAVQTVLNANRTSVVDLDLVGLGALGEEVLEDLGAGVTVRGVRTSVQTGKTRVVLDLSGPAGKISMTVLDGDTLRVEIASTLVVGAEDAVALGTPEVTDLAVGTGSVLPAHTRVDLRLGRFGKYDVVKLSPSGDSGYRVVIDVFNRTTGPPGPGGPLVALDAGHGGSDPGAVGATGLYEKNVNLSLVLRADAHLREAGLRTVLTRSTDTRVALDARTGRANEACASVFVCVHNNAASSSAANGTETYYWGDGTILSVEGRLLATAVQNSLVKALGSYDRKARTASWLYVLNHTDMPAVLTEVGFLTNPAEEAKLKDPVHVDRAAQAITDGILEYLGWPRYVD
jgi:N-acetylmuramoyl-L-alanine amidase